MAVHTSVAFCTSSGWVCGSGVTMTWRVLYSAASAWATPDCSLPAMGWAGTKLTTLSRSTRRAVSTTSRLVEPTSITSMPSLMPWRMAPKVASVAATGTATSTMSEPDTASSADSAATSITPSRLASSVVLGDLL